MSKFKVGDIAIYVDDPSYMPVYEKIPGTFRMLDGMECEIICGLFQWADGDMVYGVIFTTGHKMAIQPRFLRKRRPPEQPADQDFQEWFDKTIINPITEPLVQEKAND